MDAWSYGGGSLSWCQLLSFLVSNPNRLHPVTLIIAFSSWYKRSEFGIRAALFFSAATVSGAFGGLLAVRHPHLLSDPALYIFL